MLWNELETTLEGLTNYHKHLVTERYPDGITCVVRVWKTVTGGVSVTDYLVQTQPTEAGLEVLSYKVIK